MTAKELNIIDNNEYQQWLQQLCTEIDKQRLKAAMQLNAATLQHYWWLGNDIIRQQKEQGWGAKVIDQLSVDLQKRYGNDSGYSIRNLKYMKQFAEEYPDFPFVQVPLAQITWYHHISMLPNKGRVCSSRHDPAIGCCRIPNHQDDRRTEIRTPFY